MSSWKAETHLAREVQAWLAAQGWDVYPEVEGYGGRADLVGVQDGLVWVVECKRTFGLGVIAQADRWLQAAHYVSVAIPVAKHSDSRRLARSVCEERGIGVIEVPDVGRELPECEWGAWANMAPVFHRHAHRLARDLRVKLSVEHKQFAPGNAVGAYWTPYKATCKQVLQFVCENPGSTIRQVVDGIKHHYATDNSARATLVRWIGRGIVPGVELDRSERVYRVKLSTP
jgi:hypothetical protein